MQHRPDIFGLSPGEAWARWPAQEPLAALWSGARAPESRWTVLAHPSASLTLPAGATKAEVRDFLDRLVERRPTGGIAPAGDIPNWRGWVGWISYDLGRVLEEMAGLGERARARADRPWPLAYFVRCDDALVHDSTSSRWWQVGEPPALLPSPREAIGAGFCLARANPSGSARDYMAGVERVREYIRAGDVYQVNLAHRISSAFGGSSRGLFAALAHSARPWHGVYVEADSGGRRLICAGVSPELFLSFDPATRRLVSRPMKGTRPTLAGEAALRDSAKDRAELAMIVDLMRNDLGRVCELASVRVDEPRRIEHHAHGGSELLQATATVSGALRAGASLFEVLCAAFPPGSVTGAPKIRAMQVIDELEPFRRGPYCGCAGFIGDDGRLALCVSIRTACMSGLPGPAGPGDIRDGVVDYWAGAGLVADSDPGAEWQETLDKAGVFLTAGAGEGGGGAAEGEVMIPARRREDALGLK